MKKDHKEQSKDQKKNLGVPSRKITENTHLGSSNAFEETENPLSRDADDISDEKLDELIGDE
ncbi:MAG TPA: hypothetical protein VII28_09690 [Puia sp.]